MDFNIDFNLVRSQKLLLIPQLKQALEILEMNSQELFTYIEEQSETNPALEITADDKLLIESEQDEDDGLLLEEKNDALTLKQHLLLQLNTLDIDKNQKMIGEYLIDNTDENGYLAVDVCEVAAFFNIPMTKVNKVLKIIHAFDPPGICARNLKECLTIQLKQQEKVNNKAILIVKKYLDDLASDDAAAVSAYTGIESSEVSDIFKTIKALEPRPGRDFYKNENAASIIADVIVRNIYGRYEAIINEEAFPDVNLSDSCKLWCGDEMEADGGTFIHSRMNNAVWLIKCIEQRKNIILRIAEKLLIKEAGFFENGNKNLKLIDVAEFANEVDMHDSILMRAINGKYLQCRWGTFELNNFFYVRSM